MSEHDLICGLPPPTQEELDALISRLSSPAKRFRQVITCTPHYEPRQRWIMERFFPEAAKNFVAVDPDTNEAFGIGDA